MKKRFFIVVLLFSLFIFILTSSNSKPIKQVENNSPTVTPTINLKDNEGSFDINIGENTISNDYFYIKDPNKIRLFSNLDKQLASDELFNSYNCNYLTNASFYTKENNNIGLFVTNSQTLSPAIENSFFNGYFYVDNGKAFISKTTPKNPIIAIQSGPVIVYNSSFESFDLTTDKEARRVLVLLTNNSRVYFLVSYNKNSGYSGPLLSDLKDVINGFTQKTDEEVISAINLDGGSASAFISPSYKLTEIVRIGSLFCIED